jgi:hypothetical protein
MAMAMVMVMVMVMVKMRTLSKRRLFMKIFSKITLLIASLAMALLSSWAALSNLSDRSYAPEWARFFVSNPNSLVAKGNQLILKNNSGAFGQLDTLSRRILVISPLNIPALYQRSTWLKSAGSNAKTLSIMTLAKKLSRRSKAVNFWFIQWSAENGQIDRLLDHYDFALKTNKDVGAQLFPALTQSLEIPEGRIHFAKKVKEMPAWIHPALDFAISSNKNPVNIAETLFIANGLASSQESWRIENMLLGSLINKNEMLVARRFYLSLSRSKPKILQSINFSKDSVYADLAPITWGGINSQSATGEFNIPQASTKPILTASAIESSRGLVARRLFFPELGEYKIAADPRLTGSQKAQLFFVLNCIVGKQLNELYRHQANSVTPLPVLKIEKKCDAVYFDIELDTGEGQEGSQLELRSLAMEKLK